ncbi:MAG: ribonuclease HII [Thermonemataceae bacterium]
MLQASFSSQYVEAGLDEVGRGCLAGPVVAAAVIFPLRFVHPLLNDSKKLKKAHRISLEKVIKEEALAWAVAEVSHKEIDRINILNASFLAMHKALDDIFQQKKEGKISTTPELLLVDGNRFKPYNFIAHQCVVKGDAKFYSIAAASVLAKTYRDRLMEKLSKKYPQYGWEKNVGYPTTQHRQAIATHGLTPYHRKTFKVRPISDKK